MKKRTVIVLALLSLCLITSVSSFSRANAVSILKLPIAKQQKALVSVYEKKSIAVNDTGVCTPGTIIITNNTSKPIKIRSIACQNRNSDSLFRIGSFDANLAAGQTRRVQISLASQKQRQGTFERPIKFQLDARWDGGKALIDFAVTVDKKASAPSAPIVQPTTVLAE